MEEALIGLFEVAPEDAGKFRGRAEGIQYVQTDLQDSRSRPSPGDRSSAYNAWVSLSAILHRAVAAASGKTPEAGLARASCSRAIARLQGETYKGELATVGVAWEGVKTTASTGSQADLEAVASKVANIASACARDSAKKGWQLWRATAGDMVRLHGGSRCT